MDSVNFTSVRVFDFVTWRQQARRLLGERVPPEFVSWIDGYGQESDSLDLCFDDGPTYNAKSPVESFRVPKEFLELAELCSCNIEPKKWEVFYRVLWRIAVLGERNLLRISSDPDVRQMDLWRKAVGRERHKMKAFVRFRLVEGRGDEREAYVAWYEPVHDVVALVAPFFRDRFASMDWSILTPHRCVHWDRERLSFSPGVDGSGLNLEDDVEVYWKTYYGNIFNPARLNISMMEREMPRRYWKNLPEADLIGELTQEAYGRTRKMIERSSGGSVDS